jgi:hypothetical protein
MELSFLDSVHSVQKMTINVSNRALARHPQERLMLL